MKEFLSQKVLKNLLSTGVRVAVSGSITLALIVFRYGRGAKVVPEMDCLRCYRPRCDVQPTCMERIAPQRMLAAIRELLPLDHSLMDEV